MTCKQFAYFGILSISCFSLVGCPGGSGGLQTYPAGGVVKFSDGQPISGATVTFLSPQGELARAITDAEGKFQLGTREDTDGAVEGKHRVAVVPEIVRGSKSPPPPVPDRYQVAENSGIELEVKADGENQFEIKIDRSK
jgi:hypothetical protein